MRPESLNWWNQAKADLEAAKKNIQINEYSVSVFLSQQAAEKALKALFIEVKKDEAYTHDLVELGADLAIPSKLVANLQDLGPEYVISRYPGASYGAPYKLYSKEKAELRHKQAREVIGWVKEKLRIQ